jgi:hypothetical protein
MGGLLDEASEPKDEETRKVKNGQGDRSPENKG